jgi:branched-chain amino acid transport system substrate-binding protein
MRAFALSLLILVGVGTSCDSGTGSTAGPVIVIGSDLPASESADALSASLAVRLAITQHPQIGRYRLTYKSLDDSPLITSPVKGLQNIRRLVADGRVLGMVGPFTSNAFDQIPIGNDASLAMLSPSNTNWCLTLPNPQCNPQPSDIRVRPNNYFRIVAPDPVQGRAMARFAAGTLQIKRAAAFTLSQPFDDVTLKGFADEFKRDGGDLVFSANLPDGTKSFVPFLQAARSRGADAIYAATEADVCKVRAQMKGIFPDGDFFLGMDTLSGLEGSPCIQVAKDNADGMVATVSVADLHDGQHPGLKTLVDAYRNAYPHAAAISPYGIHAYDCALILIQAITQAVNRRGGGFPKRQEVVAQIATSTFSGVSGRYSFDGNGDAVSPLMAVYEVKGGGWVYLQQIDASANSA